MQVHKQFLASVLCLNSIFCQNPIRALWLQQEPIERPEYKHKDNSSKRDTINEGGKKNIFKNTPKKSPDSTPLYQMMHVN